MRSKDLTGKRFGRWVVIEDSGDRTKKQEKLWACECLCGNRKKVTTYNLKKGISKSCGCLNKEIITKHGNGDNNNKTYKAWLSMKTRCYNNKYQNYHRYGGRGIFVCRRWRHSFENFLADMGERPEGRTLDRIDNDGPYGPWNCRWATDKEQIRNRNMNKLNEDNVIGIKKLLKKGTLHKVIAEKFNIGVSTVSGINVGRTWKDIKI